MEVYDMKISDGLYKFRNWLSGGKLDMRRRILDYNVIPEEFALKVYQILVDDCGASDDQYSSLSFVAHAIDDGVSEWLFVGRFGFGGKFINNGVLHNWFVVCGPEDKRIIKREQINIDKANKKLSILREQLMKEYGIKESLHF